MIKQLTCAVRTPRATIQINNWKFWKRVNDT